MIAVLLAVWTQAGPADKLALRPAADFAIAGVGLAGFVIPELLKQDLAPARCRICDGPDNSGLPGTGSRGSLNGVDAWFHEEMTGWILPRRTADTLSQVVAFAIVPAGALLAAGLATGPAASEGAGLRAAVIVVESSAVSAACRWP